jgi:hypothetical protein
VENFGGLLHRPPAEEAQLHDPGSSRVDRGQRVKRAIQVEDVEGRFRRRRSISIIHSCWSLVQTLM